MRQIRKQMTYANVMSTIAVFLLLGGATAFAASKLGKNSVGTKQLRAHSVTAAKLKKNSVTGKKVRDNAITTSKIADNAITTSKIADNAITTSKIADGTVTGAKVQAATLGTVPNAATFSGYSRRGIVRVAASPTVGNSGAATRAASPEVPLISTGPFTVYAKCFDFPNDTNGAVFIRTSEDGAIFAGEDRLEGDPAFLNRDTPEDAREIRTEITTDNSARYLGSVFAAMTPGGATVRGNVQVGVKRGTPPGGDGIYGSGNVCLFAAEMTALND